MSSKFSDLAYYYYIKLEEYEILQIYIMEVEKENYIIPLWCSLKYDCVDVIIIEIQIDPRITL